jgi:excisionase family DNA binding protein
MLLDLETNRKCITTLQASESSGLSKVHLARLLREGTLEGIQLGRDWLIYTDSLEKYLTTPHKPGPKGPIKKTSAQKQQNETSAKEDANE